MCFTRNFTWSRFIISFAWCRTLNQWLQFKCGTCSSMQIFYFTHSRTIEWIRSRFHCQITHWNKVEILFSFACRAFYEHSFWHWNMCACVAAASNRLFWFASFLFLCDLHLVCLSWRERESERSHSQAIQHKRIYLYTFHLTVKCPEHKKKKKYFILSVPHESIKRIIRPKIANQSKTEESNERNYYTHAGHRRLT